MSVKRVSITVFSVLFSLLLSSFVYAQRNQPEVVSIPDANLAAAVREIIGDSITTHTLLNLTHLDVPNSGITDLTGLEHAHSLTYLGLGGQGTAQGITNNNRVSNFSPLAGLTNLTLDLSQSSLSDVAPLRVTWYGRWY